jgi:predicted transcriptional regulator
LAKQISSARITKKELVEATGLSDRSIERQLHKLVEEGLIIKHEGRHDNGGLKVEYSVGDEVVEHLKRCLYD